MVKNELPAAKFIIVGDRLFNNPSDEGYPEQVKILVDRLGLGPDTVCTGFRNDVPDILGSMDMLVVSSLRQFKSVASTVPLGLISASGGKRFGAGSGFGGDEKTFGYANGRFSRKISRQDDGWQEKEERIPLIWIGTHDLRCFLL